MLTGDYDYLTTPEDGQRTADQIKGGEFIEMKGIGHFPMSENHQLFREYLLQALQRIESRVGIRTGGGQQGEQDKGLLDKAKDALT
jgi:hypothetical protein